LARCGAFVCAGVCRSTPTLGLPMLRIESLRSTPCVVGCTARELAARQSAALTERFTVPHERALRGARLRRLSPSKFIRCAGAVTRAGCVWQARCSSLALPQAAGPGRGSVQAPASPVPVASARCGTKRSHTFAHRPPRPRLRSRLWPNPSFERTATGGRRWRAAGCSSAPVSAAQLQR